MSKGHKAIIDDEQIAFTDEDYIFLRDTAEILRQENGQLRSLITWIGNHIHVRNANGQRTTAKCAICPFTYKKDVRGRMVKEPCRHGEIWST